jgi:hypothetical protein
MRTILMAMLMVCLAGRCFADDPLETLNTVEDTVSTMEHVLKEQGQLPREGKLSSAAGLPAATSAELYFVSDGALGNRQWIMVKPCSRGAHVTASSQFFANCGIEDGLASSSRLWKGRAATAGDLKPGLVVAVRQEGAQDRWFIAKVTDLSELQSGYVGVSAPFKAHLDTVKVIEE